LLLTLGQDTYAMNIPYRDRQAWTGGELYSYPLYFCQRARCAAERGEVTMAQYHVKNGSSVDKAFKVRGGYQIVPTGKDDTVKEACELSEARIDAFAGEGGEGFAQGR
jgi:hypothetical protein